MPVKRIILAGAAAGVLCHIFQGTAAFLIFDRFYLANPDIVRDSTHLVGFYYLVLNLIVGVAIAYLSALLLKFLDEPDWRVGIKSGLIIWVASSPVWIIKRQIVLNLSNWLLFEIVIDFLIYGIIGAVAGFLLGRGIIDKD
ncbi:MAG: hypothetical protein V3V99_14400 [candidate division Zixibacteria bacterium]